MPGQHRQAEADQQRQPLRADLAKRHCGRWLPCGTGPLGEVGGEQQAGDAGEGDEYFQGQQGLVQRAGGEGAVTLCRAGDGTTGNQQQDHCDPAQPVAVGGPGHGRQQQIHQGAVSGIAGQAFPEQEQKCQRERQHRQRDLDGRSYGPGRPGSARPAEQQGREGEDAGGIAHPPGGEDDRMRGLRGDSAHDQAAGADPRADQAHQQGDQHELGDRQGGGQAFSRLHPGAQEIATQHRFEGVADGNGRRHDDSGVARGDLIRRELGIVGGEGANGDPRQYAIAEQQQGAQGDARGRPHRRCVGVGEGQQQPETGGRVVDRGQGKDGEQPLQAGCRAQCAMPHGVSPFRSVTRSWPPVHPGAVAAFGFRLVERLVGCRDQLLHGTRHGRHRRGYADADGHPGRGSRMLMVDA
ncbi:hypothetical protein D9M68_451000 [compost metagenome]